MCTAISYNDDDHYFGRNLDLEFSFDECITITPQMFPLTFRYECPMHRHYAMIGMGILKDNYPLYFDATNEFGLSMAGLNFPGNASYHEPQAGMKNITPFEFIPWILGQCKNITEAKSLLLSVNLVNLPFRSDLPLTPLHWIIADKDGALTIESVQDGLKVYGNPIGVLTNNPTFDFQMHNLTNYLNLTASEPEDRFSKSTNLKPYSRGMGAMGLPGDFSSSSRFVKAAFLKLNSVSEQGELASVSQFFHILDSVAQVKGSVIVADGYEKTIYTSCCNTDKGIYYCKTYENSQITAVSLRKEALCADTIKQYPLIKSEQICWLN